MRVRNRGIKADFVLDATVGQMPDSIRLFYILLWMVCDDAGWFQWEPTQLGVALYPWRSPKTRARDIDRWSATLEESGRIIRLPCGHGRVPSFEKHQTTGGRKTYGTRDEHQRECTVPDRPYLSEQVRTGTERRDGTGRDKTRPHAINGGEPTMPDEYMADHINKTLTNEEQINAWVGILKGPATGKIREKAVRELGILGYRLTDAGELESVVRDLPSA